MTAFDSIVRMNSPIGRIEITAHDGKIVGLDIEHDGRLDNDGAPDVSSPVVEQAVRELTEYFDGTRTSFSVPVSLEGTEFQKSVWNALDSIPYGGVRSYGEIGQQTGRESAGRAVGGAVGSNPIPIIVPCHRVLASDGRITGYSGGNGISTKAWLLDLEGIAHR